MSLFLKTEGNQHPTKGKDQVSRFHTLQALSMLVVLTFLIIAFFLMLAKNYSLSQKHEKDILVKNFNERTSYLDSLLGEVTAYVDGMRIVAEDDMVQLHGIEDLNRHLEFQNLEEDIEENRYHLDIFKPPLVKEMIGNLTGQGSIKNRSEDFYREIHMALVLNPLFRSIARAIKDAAWIYYTSKSDFINIYPWVSSKDFKFSKELYTHEFYTLGLPQNNAYRQRFWTMVYVDEYGKGLMTTCAAPVYDKDRFKGTVAIDLTVDFLNTIVSQFNPKQGEMFIINDQNQLLAHPALITSRDKRTRILDEILPEGLRKSVDRFNQIKDNKITSLSSFTILRCHLSQAPWQVVYIEPEYPFWTLYIKLIGIGPVIVMIMLLIMVITMFVVTHRQFILPSKKFVNHIMARGQKKVPEMDQRIPRVWKPWFAVIDEIFDENENLAQKLKEQNERLEQRVKQRTAELVREIEERKQIQETLRRSEERFRDISFSMADWIWEVDSDGKYTFASGTVKEILGYEPEELIGKTPFDLMPKDRVKNIEEAFKRISSEKRPIVDLENWNLTKEGKIVCLLTNGVPIYDGNGEVIGYRGVDRDISDRKRAEEEQKRLEAQLQRAQKMEAIGTLAGGVAHDLNNILSGIVSYPELLLMDLTKDSPLRKPIFTIQKSGEKAAAIVQDLLTLARRGVFTREIVNLNDIVAQYMNSPEYSKMISFHSEVKVEFELANDLLNIKGSPVHLSKVVMNLVANAAEAMPHGGKISIATKNSYVDTSIRGYDEVTEGEYVVFTISDTGIGISPDDIERIFEPFFTKKVMGRSGTGLGMAVVWGTTRDHKGYIDVQSKEGKGTTFTLYFPACREILAKEEEQMPIREYSGKGESVLVVDDMAEQREIASNILKKMGYSVFSVSSGEKAIDFVKQNSVEILVLDMIMDPGIDGLETYKQIIKLYPGQKAIIASGFTETARVKEAQMLGAGQYVKKPYNLEKICMAVRKELDK